MVHAPPNQPSSSRLQFTAQPPERIVRRAIAVPVDIMSIKLPQSARRPLRQQHYIPSELHHPNMPLYSSVVHRTKIGEVSRAMIPSDPRHPVATLESLRANLLSQVTAATQLNSAPLTPKTTAAPVEPAAASHPSSARRPTTVPQLLMSRLDEAHKVDHLFFAADLEFEAIKPATPTTDDLNTRSSRSLRRPSLGAIMGARSQQPLQQPCGTPRLPSLFAGPARGRVVGARHLVVRYDAAPAAAATLTSGSFLNPSSVSS